MIVCLPHGTLQIFAVSKQTAGRRPYVGRPMPCCGHSTGPEMRSRSPHKGAARSLEQAPPTGFAEEWCLPVTGRTAPPFFC